MNGKRAKAMRMDVKHFMGLDKLPRPTKYQYRNPKYMKAWDPELGEVVDEMCSYTVRLHPSEPRAVYQRFKRMVKKGLEWRRV